MEMGHRVSVAFFVAVDQENPAPMPTKRPIYLRSSNTYIDAFLRMADHFVEFIGDRFVS